MNSAASRQAIHPYEMKQIELIFDDILREQGLTRRSEAAEWIARRLIATYQSGIHDGPTLKLLADFDGVGHPATA